MLVEQSIPDRQKSCHVSMGDWPIGRRRGGHVADLGGILQYPLLYRSFYPGRKGGLKMTSQKFPPSFRVVRHVASQKGHLLWAPTLKSLSGGVSFRNLVRMGSLSLKILWDFIPINSGPVLSVGTFHFVPCSSKFSQSSKNIGSGSCDWIQFHFAILRKVRLFSSLFFPAPYSW